jgi:hypothetical protein
MSSQLHRLASAATLAALLGGVTVMPPAQAQTVPPAPVVSPTIGQCAAAAGLSSCLGPVIPSAPVVIIPGLDGGRNAGVDWDVDRHRTPGRVVIVE